MSSRRIKDSSYSLTGFEKAINATVQWFFFYRMIWVISAVGAIIVFAFIAWNTSLPVDRIKNIATVLTCGSIIIGIFYAILNYEINYYKYKKDRILARKQASFQIASEWHKDAIVHNLKITKKLYEENKHLIDENKSKEFSELLESNEEARAALLSIFNYLECLSLGISEDIHDEDFMHGFFRSIFISYLNDYDFYIQYRRKKYNNANVWIKFTELAAKWRSNTSINQKQ